MARFAVTKEELVEVIAKLENPNAIEQGKKKGKKAAAETTPVVSPFLNRSALFKAVCETEWAKSKGGSMQPHNIVSWVAKHNIPLLTPVGKRGRQKGQKIDTTRKNKGRNEDNYKAMIKSLEMQSGRGIQPSMAKTADRAASGSMKAAIKLKCMDCCGHEKKYVRECSSLDCALWRYRPYQAADASSEPEVVQIGLPAVA